MIQTLRLDSQLDPSINLVSPQGFEARFVQREPHYFIFYLSTQAGCHLACRFCHLTQTKQTSQVMATQADMETQVRDLLYAIRDRPFMNLNKIHVNFMARGDFLENPTCCNNNIALFWGIEQIIRQRYNVPVVFNVSSILPESLRERPLVDVFKDNPTNYRLYYSLYSVRPSFRARWLPKALSVDEGLTQIRQWQRESGKPLVFHQAFIEGENDAMEDLEDMFRTIEPYGLEAKFNLVRYNPYSALQGKEPSEEHLQRLFARIQEAFPNPRTRMVPRVGRDVYASCGTFIDLRSA